MRQRHTCLVGLLVLSLLATPAAAAANQERSNPQRPPQAGTDQPTPRPDDSPDDGDNGGASGDLKKLGFGLALGFRWNVLSPDVVEAASVDANGIVRVDKRANTHAGFTLESHYLAYRNKAKTFGVGPFVAAEAGSDAIISSVGLGLMFAWKVDDDGKGFGLGFGYSAQPSAKVLGDEFVDGELAPVDKDGKPLAVRLQDRDKGSVMIVLSVVF